MAYKANPFLERMSERTTSDNEFVELFSPKILEKLPHSAFGGGVHIFTSAPGGGKTTLLRAFTPTALSAFWRAKKNQAKESYQRLTDFGVIDDGDGPQLLGVMLSCAAGYADLPSSATNAQDGLFRSLLNCRIVLRTLRCILPLVDIESIEHIDSISLEYDQHAADLKHIPLLPKPSELIGWAEELERAIYERLDSLDYDDAQPEVAGHLRFEGILWLQGVKFVRSGKVYAPRRLLMIDDMQKLRRKQRELLIREVIELRPQTPIWIAERSIALGDSLLSQGARLGRDIDYIPLEDLWTGSPSQYLSYAQNILERRLHKQTVVPLAQFSSYLHDNVSSDNLSDDFTQGVKLFREGMARHENNIRYSSWLKAAESKFHIPSYETLLELYATRILVARDESKRQMTLELAPLSDDDRTERDSSSVKSAAEIFIHQELGIPYYFGIEKLCLLSTTNVEELLGISAALYDSIQAKLLLKKQSATLSPREQEKCIKEFARRKREFIPRNHSDGLRAQRILDSIGVFCREKTFQPSAPYAPGVTGIRLSQTDLMKLSEQQKHDSESKRLLKKVLSECVAENLLFIRESSATTSRELGTVFYLNRTLCAHFDLPMQLGGWQDVSIEKLIDWMENGLQARKLSLEF